MIKKTAIFFTLALIALAFIFSTLDAKTPAHNWKKPPQTKKYPLYIDPALPTPSEWCRDNPDECRQKETPLQKINTKRERCMDLKGDSDGFISPWEVNAFGQSCP